MAKPPDDDEVNRAGSLSAEDERRTLELARGLIIRLFGRLDHAFNESPDLVDIETERRRLAGALWSVAAFLGKGGFDLPFAYRFFELGSAIEDLNLGIRSELLAPVAQGSRRSPDPAKVWRARACAALALEALIKAGRKREAASKELIGRFPNIKHLLNKKRSAGGTVTKALIEWRKKLRSAKNWQVTEFYTLGNECIARLAASDRASDRLVRFANDMGGRASQLALLTRPVEKSPPPRKKAARRPQRDPKGRYQY
jgi:hypothetical protein